MANLLPAMEQAAVLVGYFRDLFRNRLNQDNRGVSHHTLTQKRYRADMFPFAWKGMFPVGFVALPGTAMSIYRAVQGLVKLRAHRGQLGNGYPNQ
ncbi:MAG: hypothetical protein KJT03_14470 [Verrucomicrobiae bacterium]|nr:hypothetical protein [Verrucomicrobiae bacterium]